MAKNEGEWLVSDASCRGCKYYGNLSKSGSGTKCCDYTYYTGKVRRNKPKKCEVKVKGARPKGFTDMKGITKSESRKEYIYGNRIR